MKPILTLFFLLVVFDGFSGDLNRSDLECGNQQNFCSTSDRILVVVNAWTGMDQQSIESCMNGLEITLDLHSQSKIADIIFVEKKPDPKLIKELQKKYSVTGLLFLSRLKIQKQAYDVESKRVYQIPERHDIVKHPAYWGTIPWTNLYAQITSKWKYYDLDSGKQYDFEIKNKKIFELGRYVSDIDSLIEANQTMFDPLLYENGKILAEKLLKIQPFTKVERQRIDFSPTTQPFSKHYSLSSVSTDG